MERTGTLRNAISDAALLIGSLEDEITMKGNVKVVPIEQVRCECCGMKEDCSSNYIDQVKGIHSGRYVCGLCSEAVKERLTHTSPEIVMGDALSLHQEFCKEFTTARMNPKLSLTFSMRDIARRSFQHRISSKDNALNLMGSKLARTSSCMPRIDH